MDEAAGMTTIDSGTLPEGTADRPLVTFAIFGYNQAKFIRQAIEGAFNQNYEPMEIILSDDCSTDGTFEIMVELAELYLGPKKIIARRTIRNLGTLSHVVDVAKWSRGQLLILAAGDDVSKPERTLRLVNAWLTSRAWGFYSRFDRIDEQGTVLTNSDSIDLFMSQSYRLRHYLGNDEKNSQIIHGATSAYDRRLFDFLDLNSNDYILSEDGVLSVLLNMIKKEIIMVGESLVYYRESTDSLTNGKKDKWTLSELREDERKIEVFARSQANRCALFLRLNDSLKGTEASQLNDRLLNIDIVRHRMRAQWRATSFISRISYIYGNFVASEVKWALPRVFSVEAFLFSKVILRFITRHLGNKN